jgi:hypothetical protein
MSHVNENVKNFLYRHRLHPAFAALFLFASLFCALATAQQPAAQNAAPDVLVLSNGDTLHGKLVSEAGGTVTFHTDPLGDVPVTWDKIKELHTAQKFAVIKPDEELRHRRDVKNLPVGTVAMTDQNVQLQPANQAAVSPVPVKDAAFIVDEASLNKQAHEPGFFVGWNGTATGGATIVEATQKQYNFVWGLSLVRAIPTVPWLDPTNRTSADFLGSFGKTIQPSYFSGGVFVPDVVTKTSIFHADAERDEYFTPRWYVLGLTAFDHNYSQNLDLQQIYGGGIGWTAIKTPKQELDLKATVQYEKQQFMGTAPGSNLNLVGSTFAANYLLKMKYATFNQQLAYIPAWNDMSAYSLAETDLLTFPTYKNLGFSIGTIDTYLNNPPIALPPTQRNSFQFILGLTYALVSKY